MITYVDSRLLHRRVDRTRGHPRIVTEDVPGTFEATVAAFDLIAHSPKGPSCFAAGAFDRTVKAQSELPPCGNTRTTRPSGSWTSAWSPATGSW
jgi:hypothetical protein